MKLSEVKIALKQLDEIKFCMKNGMKIPSHFHITEVGKVSKHFIDCGGVERMEMKISFQLWKANDYNHRLSPKKLLSIIKKAEDSLKLGNLGVEVEYQADTIGRFGLEFENGTFILTNTQTNCLAPDMCGIPPEKPKRKLSDLTHQLSCPPKGNCC
ncbi:MAG: hypothetical protein EBR72_02285 [Bacteroidetes bacterium]|nr:hypothetical protein [Bacteroidota bacterium]